MIVKIEEADEFSNNSYVIVPKQYVTTTENEQFYVKYLKPPFLQEDLISNSSIEAPADWPSMKCTLFYLYCKFKFFTMLIKS